MGFVSILFKKKHSETFETFETVLLRVIQLGFNVGQKNIRKS